MRGKKGNAQGGACAEPPFAREEERKAGGRFARGKMGERPAKGRFCAERRGTPPKDALARGLLFAREREANKQGRFARATTGNGLRRSASCVQRAGERPTRDALAPGRLARGKEKRLPPRPGKEALLRAAVTTTRDRRRRSARRPRPRRR